MRCSLEQLGHRSRIGQRHIEDGGVTGHVDPAGQSRDFLPVRAEQDHRRVTVYCEGLAVLLRAGRVAIEIDGHEQARALLELPLVEDRRLDLRARRTPLGAPVQEQGLIGRLRRGEGGVYVAVEPVDALGKMSLAGAGRCSGRWCRVGSGRLAAAARKRERDAGNGPGPGMSACSSAHASRPQTRCATAGPTVIVRALPTRTGSHER